jgi:hypothetical protein
MVSTFFASPSAFAAAVTQPFGVLFEKALPLEFTLRGILVNLHNIHFFLLVMNPDFPLAALPVMS